MNKQKKAPAKIARDFKELLEVANNHHDKDDRFMAGMDLCNKMLESYEAGQSIDSTTEKRICEAFIKHLTDSNSDVQTNAVKSIELVISYLKETNIQLICEKLTDQIVNAEKSSVRDLFGLALHKTIQEIHGQASLDMIRHVNPILKKGLKSSNNEVQEQCLEICALIFKQFGGALHKKEDLIKRSEFSKLFCDLQGSNYVLNVRRKASLALGSFSLILSTQQLSQLIQTQIAGLASQNQLSCLEAISHIATLSGHRLSSSFDNLLPKLQKFCQNLPESETDENNEIAQTSLTAIENLILKCPQEAGRSLNTIYKTIQTCLVYDPGYTYTENDDEDMNDEDYGEWGDEFEDDDMQQADDSTAWKVRKGAVKVVIAVVKSCGVYLKEYWQRLVMLLSGRFIERDDTVKADLLRSFDELAMASIKIDEQIKDSFKTKLVRRRSYTEDLNEGFVEITQNLIKQASHKSLNIRIQVLRSLSILADLLKDRLEDHLKDIVQIIFQQAGENNVEIYTYSLRILQSGFRQMTTSQQLSNVAVEESDGLNEFLKTALGNQQSKVQNEALKTIGQYMLQMQGLNGLIDDDQKETAVKMYDLVISKLSNSGVDQDVKFGSIIAMAKILKVSHQQLPANNLSQVIAIFKERLQVELTREPTVKALILLAEPGDEDNIVPLVGLNQLTPQLMKLLVQNSRQIQVLTLKCIYQMMESYPQQFASDLPVIQKEVLGLIQENDIYRSSWAIKCSTAVLNKGGNLAHSGLAIEKCVAICNTSQTQEAEFAELLQQFFRVAVAKGCFKAQAALNKIIEQLFNQISLKSRLSAKILASISFELKAQSLWQQWESYISHTANDDNKLRGVLIIGELGMLKDLSANAKLFDSIQKLFQVKEDQIRQASAIALGGITIGNANFFLPKVFDLIAGAESRHNYILLSTLKEIVFNKPGILKDAIGQLMNLYLEQAGSKDELIRNTVSESIGRLFLTQQATLRGHIEKALAGGQPLVVSTFARSFKYSALRNDNAAHFVPFVKPLIDALSVKNLEVKRNVLQALSQIVLNPELKNLVGVHVETLTALVLLETPIKKELIIEVDLGAFKDKKDMGIPIRKDAYALLEAMIDAFPNIDLSAIVNSVIQGFKDTNENIQVLCLNFMIKLFRVCTSIVVSKMDNLVESFNNIYEKNKKHLSKDGEAERALSLMRAIFRVCNVINAIEEAKSNVNFDNWFTNTILSNQGLKDMFEKVSQTA